ncbi:hypothetical protein, partial [Mesorhizobium sp.]|uniref:hypothetical protein n=1 Tax=Mesorhizobium sp. TaxID=1871066 RepID=UPI0025C37377
MRRAIRQWHRIFLENLAHRKIVARPGFGVYNACDLNSAPPRSAPGAASQLRKIACPPIVPAPPPTA